MKGVISWIYSIFRDSEGGKPGWVRGVPASVHITASVPAVRY